jgi:hypothetical protein
MAAARRRPADFRAARAADKNVFAASAKIIDLLGDFPSR